MSDETLFNQLRADIQMRLNRGDGPRSFVVERAFDAMNARLKKRKLNEANQDAQASKVKDRAGAEATQVFASDSLPGVRLDEAQSLDVRQHGMTEDQRAAMSGLVEALRALTAHYAVLGQAQRSVSLELLIEQANAAIEAGRVKDAKP